MLKAELVAESSVISRARKPVTDLKIGPGRGRDANTRIVRPSLVGRYRRKVVISHTGICCKVIRLFASGTRSSLQSVRWQHMANVRERP